jgi:hypothetical protein
MRAEGAIVKQLAAAAVLAVSAMGSAVAAPLMGSTLNYTYYYPVLGTTYAGTPNPNGNFVVGPGEEIYSLTDGVGSLDVTANQVIVDFSYGSTFGAAEFSGWVLSDVFGTIDNFISVTLDASTTLAGMVEERLGFTADTISVNWGGLRFEQGDRLVLNVVTGESPVPIPEPGTLPLLAAALLGIAVIRRNG